MANYSEAVKNKVFEELRGGRSTGAVCKAFHLTPSTVRRWIHEAEESGNPVVRFDGKSVLEPHGTYDDELRTRAVEMALSGKTCRQIFEELGVPISTAGTWVRIARKARGLTQEIGVECVKRGIENLRIQDKDVQRAKKKHIEAERDKVDRVQEMIADPLIWMQKHTETKDSHWRERGAKTPYRPFPDKPYFRPAIEDWQREPVVFIEKSRNMMLSWLAVGFFTHAAMTTPGIEVLFQSQKEDKAFELVDYAKVLYDRQSDELKEAFPLVKKLKDMADGELVFANGSRIIGIPGGADQIRSYHPWGLLMDEAAFMPEAGDSYNNAVPVCQKILMVSSAAPGWFADVCNSGTPV
jgi:transposase-like protein